MRDTEPRENLAAQPLPDRPEPLPVDEAGLEKGDGRATDDRDVTGGPMDDRAMDGRAWTDADMNDGRANDADMNDGHGMDVEQPDRDGVPQDTATPVDATPMPATAPQHAAGSQEHELFAGDFAERLRARWRELQADFVDDPQRAVRAADEVVDEVMRTITEHRERLAGEWQGHTDTEHLRLALREYRSFFDRLLPS